ncbi:MAG TPA: EamA family transporter [Clostridiales bacterium]|nr:EamA family transporter [Clostridiales bacterium]
MKSEKNASQTLVRAERRASLSGPIFIVLSALFWSTSGVLIKYIPWHPMAIASGRSLIAALVMALFFGRRVWRKPNFITLLSSLCMGLTQSLYIIANKLTTAANAIMLQYVSPIFIMIIGAIFLHVRPTKREIIVSIIAFSGIFLFFFDNMSAGNQIGNALALFTGLTFAVVFVINGRPECHSESALVMGQLLTMLAGLPFLVQVDNVVPVHVLALVLLGTCQLALGYILFNRGIHLTSPLNASLISMIEPIMNPVWVLIFIGEKPGPLALLGGLTVISAILFLNLEKLKRGHFKNP